MVFNDAVNDDIEGLNEIFVLVDGLQVPFPMLEMVLLTDTSAQLRLEFLNCQKEALALVGCEVYAVVAPVFKQKTQVEHEKWIGFAVRDLKYGKIGVIKQIEDYKGNIVMKVMDGSKETLISLYSDLVTDIDNNAKILHITAPDGYFSD